MQPDKKFLKLLTNLGLGHKEALTYAALLQTDTVSIRRVAAISGINRGTTYDALKHLIVLGLVSVKKRGARECFTAESPERIHDLIREKRRDLLEASTTAKAVIPGLLSKHRHTGSNPIVRYYEGDEGVVTILKDVLETCRTMDDPCYHTYSSRQLRQYLYRKFPTFTERRIAAGIKVKVIAMGEGGELAAGAERKWLPNTGSADTSSYTLIYGDKVAIISVSNNLVPFGLIVEEQSTANMHRLLFNHLWQYL